jgi:peptidyl-tRNA hydrolase, PTH1 family
MTFLVVGLGNPGEAYGKTRHNIGARVIQELAQRRGIPLRRKFFWKAQLGRGFLWGQDLLLLIPSSYMNVSGPVIAGAMNKAGVLLDHLLILVDDVNLPFGRLRLKGEGGTGGHNGLKSLEEALGTEKYARLRIGVGNSGEGDLAEYVLSLFTAKEEELVPSILERAFKAIELWITEGLNRAMNGINQTLR